MKTIFKILAVLCEVLFVNHGFGQTPSIQWSQCYGGIYGDIARSVRQTNDGGFIIVGGADVPSGYIDIAIIKTDSIGFIEWQKQVPGVYLDLAINVEQLVEGGYVVVGYKWISQHDYDYTIIKTDSVGNIIWQKNFGGSGYDEANSVKQTPDYGFIVAGESHSPNDGDVTGNNGGYDYWVIRLDSAGTLIWEKSFGGSQYDFAQSVELTSDGGFILAGGAGSNDSDVTNNHGSGDYWIVKLDSIGTMQWQKTYGGSSADGALWIAKTNDGGYIMAGNSTSNDSDVAVNYGITDYWIVKIDSIGAIQWQQSFGGSDQDIVASIQQTKDNGYLIGGWTESNDFDVTGNHGMNDYWLLKTDSVGNLEWQKCLGGTNSDGAVNAIQTRDSCFVILGQTLSTDTDVLCNHGYIDIWLVKLNSAFTSIKQLDISSISIFPNPTISSITIKAILQHPGTLTLYDIIGHPLLQQAFNGGAQIDLSKFPRGMYIAEVRDKDGIGMVAKLLKE